MGSKPYTDTDVELVAVALAGRIRYSQHGQRCPVWTRAKGVEIGENRAPTEAELDRCDCWIMAVTRRDGEAVLDKLAAAGWRPVPEGWRVQADRDGDMTLQCLTCFHDYDLDVLTEDLTLVRLVGLAQGHKHRGSDDGA